MKRRKRREGGVEDAKLEKSEASQAQAQAHFLVTLKFDGG